jgi:hypothetical protein
MSNDRKIVTLDDIERRHLADHRKPYYDWLRHLVTLCIGTLTALVALQGHYVPLHPKLLWALALCWAALTATIFFGILALRAEYLLPLVAVQKIQISRATVGDDATAQLISRGGLQISPSWHHRWAVRLMLTLFFLALLSLCTFAISNIGELHG